MELLFIDFKAENAVFRLMNDDIEENFDDMRVWSVVEKAHGAFVVEKHVETSFEVKISMIIPHETEFVCMKMIFGGLKVILSVENGFEGDFWAQNGKSEIRDFHMSKSGVTARFFGGKKKPLFFLRF